jgi:hypothetical protein
MGWSCRLVGETRKDINNFAEETSLQTATGKTKKDRDER